MHALDLTGHPARGTWIRAVAGFFARVDAGRLIPPTRLETLAVVHDNAIWGMHRTVRASPPAGMPAGQARLARHIAAVFALRDVHMAPNCYFVITSRYLLFYRVQTVHER